MRQLQLLVELSRQASLTAAARALHLTQPAVSQQLAEVERSLGVVVFERQRGLRLTPAGAAVLAYARRTLNDAVRTADEVAAIQAGARGLVHIGSMLVSATVLIPRAVARLRDAGDHLRLVLHEDVMQRLMPRMEQGELDVVVGRLDARVRHSAPAHEALYDDPHCVVCGPRHVLAGKRRLSWALATRYPWIMPPESATLRQAVEAHMASLGVALPETPVESGSLTATLSILLRTDCLTVISRTAARHYEAMGVLKALPLELPDTIGPIGMAWLADQPSPAVARVLEVLRAEGAALARR